MSTKELKCYKIYVTDRNYSSWEFIEMTTFNKAELDINPLEHKLLSNDVFSVDDNNKVTLIHSSVRSEKSLPGVLIIAGNKSYGRQQKNSENIRRMNKAGKLYYKCMPDDMRLPPFLVPYEIKVLGFSKVIKNLYVTFNYDEWTDKHPVGRLDNVIGAVDILDCFYEYQLYCKSLNASIQKFQKDTSKALERQSHEGFIDTIKTKYSNIEDRTNQKTWHIFSIDPQDSVDFDDAFSIIDHGENGKQLSIYISNVSIWMDILNLWDTFSRRISTIYLPDKKRPMLPTILSDCLCSLQENTTRIAFVMDIFIQNNTISSIKYSNCFIKVFKNYCYEEPSLIGSLWYQNLLEQTDILSKQFKYINTIRNSHDVVCYLMIFMNYQSAKLLIQNKTGVFRSTVIKRDFIVPNTVPEEAAKFIKIWNSAAGQYIDGSEIVDTRHELLDIDAYVHITSPIRRLVDLMNMIKIQSVTGILKLSEQANIFYNKWLTELDYINITMRSIRKVQCDCTLLDLCHNNPQIMEKEYDGYLFDKINRNDGLIQYVVFLPELKLSSRITLRDSFTNFDCKKFKLYLFNNEEKFKKKIRLNLV
jgi:hypothetical protein